MIDRFYGNIAKLSNDAYIAFRIRDLSRPMNRHRCQQPMRAADFDHSAQSTSLVTCVCTVRSLFLLFHDLRESRRFPQSVDEQLRTKPCSFLSTCFSLFCDAFNLLDWLVMYIDVWEGVPRDFLLSFIALFIELLLAFRSTHVYFQTTQNNEE